MSTMIVLDVTELVLNPVRTGIQRVVRELISRWPADITMCVARYDAVAGLVPVPDSAVKLIIDPGVGAVDLQSEEVARRVACLLERGSSKLPPGGRVFV